MKARGECLEMLKYHLSRAQHRMKSQADKGRTERSLEVGDWATIKLQPYRQHSWIPSYLDSCLKEHMKLMAKGKDARGKVRQESTTPLDADL